ncbi:MAG TPA: formylmethanofuran dehydrogenase [Albitalea sp.]
MPAWTCPFCSLLCDEFVLADGTPPRLEGSDCPRALAGLASHELAAPAPRASVDGAPASLEDALDAAADRLARWQQPLFGGLGTDIAGARALARLAHRTGAICDHADGDVQMHALRALQDRGQYQVTLGEVRRRADLLVCIGTTASDRFPEFFRRVGVGAPGSPCGGVVFVGAPVPARFPAGVPAESIAGSGDLFADLQQLAAVVQGRPLARPDHALSQLAERLLAARYAVLVWEPGTLPAHGALVAEAITRIVATLNAATRAASLPLGGNDGAGAVNQVFAWLTGLPLRTRAGPAGLEHEPLRFGARRLLDDRAVDGLLWISSFDPARVPPATDLPTLVLGPPAMGPRLPASVGVYIAVATPGLGEAGHLLRTDGIIIVPLERVRDDGVPSAAVVLAALAARIDGAAAAPRRATA